MCATALQKNNLLVLEPPSLALLCTPEISLKTGANLRLPLELHGPGRLTLELCRNDRPIYDRVLFESYGDSHYVNLRHVRRSDTDRYTIRASNELGSVSTDFQLRVLDVPETPEGPLKVAARDGNLAQLTWKEPKHDGGAPLLRYVVEHKEVHRVYWGRSQEIAPDHTETLLTSMKPGVEYHIQVVAENEVGRSSPLLLDGGQTFVMSTPYSVTDAPRGPLECNAVSDRSVELSWRPPKHDGGKPLLHYQLEMKEVRSISICLHVIYIHPSLSEN